MRDNPPILIGTILVALCALVTIVAYQSQNKKTSAHDPRVPRPSEYMHADQRPGPGRICLGTSNYSPDCGDYGRIEPGHGESATWVGPDQAEVNRLYRAHQLQDLALQKAIDMLEPGKLAYSIPAKMPMGKKTIVYARIGGSQVPDNALTLSINSKDMTTLQLVNTRVSLHMRMALTGSDFAVKELSYGDQMVHGTNPTAWVWEVLPERSGSLHLHLAAIVELGSSRQEYQTIDKDIAVTVDSGDLVTGFISRNWKYLLGVIGTVIAFLLKLFWPKKEEKTPSAAPGTSVSVGGANYGQQLSAVSGAVNITNTYSGSGPQSAPTRDFRAEWSSLSDKMSSSCGMLRADWTHNTILGESWDLKAGKDGNMCRAYMRQAGAMLLVSPRVAASLSPSVLKETEDMNRWLTHLKEGYRFDMNESIIVPRDDGKTEHIHRGTLHDLGEQSAKACVDCSTMELRG